MNTKLPGNSKTICLCIQLLGGFSVSVGDITIAETKWRSRRARSLVKLLALAPACRLHRDQVIDTLWPDSDISSAANSFHQTLLIARRVLEAGGAAVLQMEDGFLYLCSGDEQPVVVDVEQFEQAAERAIDSQDPVLYQAALDRYQGDLLPDDLYEEWTLRRREELRQVFLKLLLDLSRLYEARGEYDQGVDTIQRLLAEDRSLEDAHVELMRLYALSGQRQKALRQYQALEELLRAEFDTEPGENITHLFEQIRSGQFSAHTMQTPPPAPRHNLPAQLTSFIGREREIAEIRQLVRKHRLVTLTGSGGTGKSRLALKVAESLLDVFPDGVFLVELAPLSNPDLVPQVCAQTLEVTEQPGKSIETALTSFLEKKDLLLILDNCEHLVTACTHLAISLLKSCPQLHILITSREILSAPGERSFRVPSLAVPGLGDLLPLSELAQVESVRLFVERAAQVSSGYELTAENAGPVAQICQQLDGIPLAIELASARVRMMPVDQIAARLGDVFYLLTGGSRAALPRQQTLKATIDWSYHLLASKERLLLQRLSVFAGGWTLEEAERVCIEDEQEESCQQERILSYEVMDLLAQLVDKSLVMVDLYANRARYNLLDTICQYAFDLLLGSGCVNAMRRRHLDYFLHMAEEISGWQFTEKRLDGFDQLSVEKDNLRAALCWALEGGNGNRAEQGLRLATALSFLWKNSNMLAEGETWLRKGLEGIDSGSSKRHQLRASALCALGKIQFMRGNKYQATDSVNESISLFRQLDDPFGLALALTTLGEISVMFDTAQAWTLCEQAEAILRSLKQQADSKWHLAQLLNFMGQIAQPTGDPSRRLNYCFESIALFEETGDRWSTLEPLSQLVIIYNQTEDLVRMREYQDQFTSILDELKGRPLYENFDWLKGLIAYTEQDFVQMEADFLVSLEHCQRIENQWAATWNLRMLAIAAKHQGQQVKAAQYCLQSLNQAIIINDPAGVRSAISLMAGLVRVKQPQRSARLLGAAQALFEAFTKPMDLPEAAEFEQDSAETRAALSAEVFQSLWEEGRGLALEQAIQEARAIGAEIIEV